MSVYSGREALAVQVVTDCWLDPLFDIRVAAIRFPETINEKVAMRLHFLRHSMEDIVSLQVQESVCIIYYTTELTLERLTRCVNATRF